MAPDVGGVILLVCVMVLYATEVIPLAATALGSCALMVIFGFAPASTVWSGLAADTTLVVGGMIVVGVALLENGVAESLGDWILRKTGNKPRVSCICVILATMLLSGFMNNAAAVATMMPVLMGVVAASNEKLHEKDWLLPLAVAANTGGMLSLIGTTSQMVLQEALETHHYPTFAFFDFAWLGVPLCLLLLAYMATIGGYLGKRIWARDEPHSEMMADLSAEKRATRVAEIDRRKQRTAIVILLGAISLMVVDIGVSNGTIGMAAAVLCVATRCISIKQVYRKFDWTTVFVLAGGIGFANGMDACGGGRLIAGWLMGLLNDALTPLSVFIMFVVVATLLTQFMSNTAVAALLIPVAIPFIDLLTLNPLALFMGICAATNLSFSTPIATPSMTLVLGPGNYKFIDYVKWCGIFNVICIVFVLWAIPVIWPLTV